MSLSKREVEDWWHHPVTKAYMASLQEDAMVHNALTMATSKITTVEEVGLRTIALANRVEALMDVSNYDNVCNVLGVDDE